MYSKLCDVPSRVIGPENLSLSSQLSDHVIRGSAQLVACEQKTSVSEHDDVLLDDAIQV